MRTRILIADGDDYRLDLYRRFFTGCGFEVRAASEGLACLVELRRFPPDALVLDMHLPWGGGDGVLAHMRTDPRLRRTPIVIIHSLHGAEVASFALEFPKIQFIKKPFRLHTLLEAISAAGEPSLECAVASA